MNKNQITLVKGEHVFVFNNINGHENDFIDIILNKASDDTTQFDWYDAAILSSHFGQIMSKTFYTPQEAMQYYFLLINELVPIFFVPLFYQLS